MKKIYFLPLIALSVLLVSTALTGCGDSPVSGGVPVSQEAINNAVPGSVINFNGSSNGGEITVDRPLTLNGNNASNVSIIISSNVRENVVLRNFRNAHITISDIPVHRSGLHANTVGDTEEDTGFKHLGDDALPLKLEGCTIEKIEAEEDFALFLDNGNKKSVIDELELKEGVEDFTFVEFDKEGTATNAKSKVKELNIEDGVEKINLIGGTFNDVSFADDFTGSVDFKYDQEFEDQLNFDGKEAFLEDSKVIEKDVGVAEKAAGSTVYSFSMSKDLFDILNGHIFVVFMNENDENAPVYATIPSGFFKVDFPDLPSGSALRTIYGSEKSYVDYAGARARGMLGGYLNQDIVHLTHYKNYNKEAFVATLSVSDSMVTFYVDISKIRKEDVIICPAYMGLHNDEGCTKLSDISLEGYTPCFAADYASLPELLDEDERNARDSQIGGSFPVAGGELCAYNSVKFSFGVPRYDYVAMAPGGQYPNVGSLTYSQVPVDPNQEDPFGTDLTPESDDYLNIKTKNMYDNFEWDEGLSAEREILIEELERGGVIFYPTSSCTPGSELTAAQLRSLAKYAFIWKYVPVSAQACITVRAREGGEYGTLSLQEIINQVRAGERTYYIDELSTSPVTLEQLQSGAEFWQLLYQIN